MYPQKLSRERQKHKQFSSFRLSDIEYIADFLCVLWNLFVQSNFSGWPKTQFVHSLRAVCDFSQFSTL